ncbi:hypothetical protein [Desulfuromonas acetoxidans]|uniref:hypothetical protein n=1 Tax=Desulfuromonas acetoxidans TaxID=891 RepID=UPI00292CAB2B|nr:hypothetical protein [Desulfuromonas acetoxidans]
MQTVALDVVKAAFSVDTADGEKLIAVRGQGGRVDLAIFIESEAVADRVIAVGAWMLFLLLNSSAPAFLFFTIENAFNTS